MDLGVLRIAGIDAAVFLQGQLSNDTRRLTEGKCLLAAHSSSQGRVLAVMRLIPHSSGILAIMPRDLIAATREQLSKFVLRSKVVIEDASCTITVAGCFGSNSIQAAGMPAPAAAGDYLEVNGLGIARLSGTIERYWVLGGSAEESAAATPDGSFAAAWRRADIDAGFPQVYAATRELFVAQMLNLDLIDGISFTKGCYTGQEIIARTQHLGRIKRRMFVLRLPADDYQPGDSLTVIDGRTAKLVEVLNEAQESRALAVVSLDLGGTPDGEAPGVATSGVATPGVATAGTMRVAAVISPPPYMAAAA